MNNDKDIKLLNDDELKEVTGGTNVPDSMKVKDIKGMGDIKLANLNLNIKTGDTIGIVGEAEEAKGMAVFLNQNIDILAKK